MIRHHIARNLNVAIGVDSIQRVVVNLIGTAQIERTHKRGSSGIVIRIDADAVVIGLISGDGGSAAIEKIDSIQGTIVDMVIGDTGNRATDVDSIQTAVGNIEVIEGRLDRIGFQPYTFECVVRGRQVASCEADGTVVHPHAAIRSHQSQMRDVDRAATIHIDDCSRSARERTANRRDIRRIQRPRNTRTGTIGGGDAHRTEFIVDTRIDKHGIRRPKPIGPEQRGQQGLGRIRKQSIITIRPDGGHISIADDTAVIHKVAVSGFRNSERFSASIHRDRHTDQRNLDAQPVRANRDATILGNPCELSVVRRGGGDRQHIGRTIRGVLIEIDFDRLLRHIVVTFPANDVRRTLRPIGVEIRIAQRDMRECGLGGFLRQAAIGTEVGCIKAWHHIHERPVERAVIGT